MIGAEALEGLARVAFVMAAAGCLLLAVRRRRAWPLLALALFGAAVAWWVTNAPLQRMYALGPSADRVGNLALVQVVAAGNSPLRTSQVGQLHFEPFWGALVAALSGWSPDRVLVLYPWLSLLVTWGIALAVYAGLAGLSPGFSQWERALAALFGVLLWSAPLDFSGSYRDPWAMTVLLKPNHALGLVVFPLFLRLFAAIRGWGTRILAGVVLHLLAWVFVLHMAYVAAGLVQFALSSLLDRRKDARRDALDVAAAILVNVVIVSPYLVMLLVGYPFLQRLSIMTIPPHSPHLLETTARAGFVFALGLWGAIVCHRRGRLGRLWAAQFVAAHLIWVWYLVLSALHMARERDEVVYWARFIGAVLAGVGAFDLATRAAAALPALLEPARRAALVAGLALPFLLPWWWSPPRMDDYYPGSLQPLPERLSVPTAFLRHHTDPRAVVAGDVEYARWVSALGARRTLLSRGLHSPGDAAAREELQRALAAGAEGEAVRAPAARWGVRYVVVTPAFLARYPGATLDALEARAGYRLVHFTGARDGDFVALFELAGGGPPATRGG
jgi:hypothetical protein